MKSLKAFTLIELLIVVAIIAILAAIAVPNFLEAQTRAKVSRVKSDQRTIATALESYYIDSNRYPPSQNSGFNAFQSLVPLTTPIAYITSLEPARDIFIDKATTLGLSGGAFAGKDDMSYAGFADFRNFTNPPEPNGPSFAGWCIESFGPDRTGSAINFRVYFLEQGSMSKGMFLEGIYDPTNGTISAGGIARVGGQVPAEASALVNK